MGEHKVSWGDLLGCEEALEALSDQLICGCAVIVVRADGTVRRVPSADWFDKVFADGAQSAPPEINRGDRAMQEQIDRVETWANTLKAGQAPHQQQLADDALVLVNHAKGTLTRPDYEEGADQAKTDVGQAVATVPRDAFDQLAQERDDFQAQLKLACDANAVLKQDHDGLTKQVHIASEMINGLIDEKTALEAKIADLTPKDMFQVSGASLEEAQVDIDAATTSRPDLNSDR